MSTSETALQELIRKVDILWKLANICPKCQKCPMKMSAAACYPPMYYCPECTEKEKENEREKGRDKDKENVDRLPKQKSKEKREDDVDDDDYPSYSFFD